jgi:uncharacterized membrane protein YdbT with pleckstrin-like domain
LIFPLLRGIRAFTPNVNALYVWLKGAWFDIAIIGLIIIFGLIRWYFSRIYVTDDAIIHTEGIFFRMKTTIPYENLSSVTADYLFYLRPLKGLRVSCDTCAGILKTSDMKLVITRKVYNVIMHHLPPIRTDSKSSSYHKPSPVSLVLFSAFFSSSLSGAVYVAAFFFKGGDIAHDIISVSLEKITEETSKIAKMLIVNIPTAAIGIGSFFLATWLLSFIMNMINYAEFSVKSDLCQTEIRCGVFTRHVCRIITKNINYIDMRQNLIMKFFRIVSVNIICAGYGSSNRFLPVLLPIKHKNNSPYSKEKSEIKSIRPPISSLWTYIWQPVIGAAIIFPAKYLLFCFLPEFNELSSFFAVMIEIPLIWLLLVRITAAVTNKITICKDNITIKYSSGFAFHTITAPREHIIKISVTQNIFQKVSKKCTVRFYLNGEEQISHPVRGVKMKDVSVIADILGYNRILFPKVIYSHGKH